MKLLMVDTTLLLLINDKRKEEIAVDGVEKIDPNRYIKSIANLK